ncbi:MULTISPECIES: hypothetical protein [unclassified Streptomyces]|uniref:hypothetical protein n=1 Tax=unclassified Streptomyces TaxID=2593676 RepID=UPI000AB828AD|nr:hypothetical protein [Streptomyces sp. CB02058]
MLGWYRAADWAKHTAVAAAVIAALGLWLTAWSSWKSAQVADDQLNQSAAEQQEEARSQVSKIVVCIEGDKIVVVNRSLDPATAWLGLNKDDYAGIRMGTLPPCTRLELPRDVSRIDEEFVQAPDGKLSAAYISDITITDAAGRTWRRYPDGALVRVTLQNADPIERLAPGPLTGPAVTMTTVEKCGTSN